MATLVYCKNFFRDAVAVMATLVYCKKNFRDGVPIWLVHTVLNSARALHGTRIGGLD